MMVIGDIWLSRARYVAVTLLGSWRAFGGFWRHGEMPLL
jgi:hypothetical protein